MSSLAAARADNFYNPPNWNPSKISRDNFQNSKGSNQYEQKGLIRFEMPFNFVCDGSKRNKVAEHNVGAGTRYNAKKIAAGNYFSTRIWEFHMKCHQCGSSIVIKTNPKDRAYDILQGGRVKIETYTAKSAGVSESLSIEELNRRDVDIIFSIERNVEQKRENTKKQNSLTKLIKINEKQKNDYQRARSLRKKFREKHSGKKKNYFQGERLPINSEDIKNAKLAHLRGQGKGSERWKRLVRLQKVRNSCEPIFGFKSAVSLKSQKAIRARLLCAERGIKFGR